jgi:hypothetical protein
MELQLNKEVNGEQLLQELIAAGVSIGLDNYPKVESNKLFIDVTVDDEAKTAEVWKKHKAENWEIKREAARQALLDKLGITRDEARLLLG